MWKKLFALVSVILLASLFINSYQWQQLSLVNTTPPNVAAGQGNTQGRPNRITERYAALTRAINRRAGLGEDRKSFITPDDPAVIARVQEITGGFSEDANEYWRDVDALYRWVPKNIAYCPDTYTPLLPEAIYDELTWVRDYWRTSEETLRDKEGDCEDMVALLASMLINYNQQKYTVWVIEIRNKERGHVGVALPVDKAKLVIFDPSVGYVTGPNDALIGPKSLEAALTNWLVRWGKELPGAEVSAVFNNTFCQEFGSTEEFLSWAGRQ